MLCCNVQRVLSPLLLLVLQDAVMQQFFGLVDTLLKGSPASKQRRLGYRTYRVVPCSPLVGVLEWVEGTTPLTEYLLGSRDTQPPYSGGASGRSVCQCAGAQGSPCSGLHERTFTVVVAHQQGWLPERRVCVCLCRAACHTTKCSQSRHRGGGGGYGSGGDVVDDAFGVLQVPQARWCQLDGVLPQD